MQSVSLTIGLAMGAALLFSIGNHVSKRALNYTDSPTVTLYQIGTATLIYWLASPFFMQAAYWLTPAVIILALIGLFRPLLSANLGTAGTRILGPTISSTLSASGPIVGVTLGVIWFGELLPWQSVAGTAGIVTAVVVLSWRGQAKSSWPAIALLLPLGAALVRAVTHGFAKFGMETIPSPLFVALVSYSVSLPLALLYDRMRGTRVVHKSIPIRGLALMTTSGSLYALAVFLLNTALLHGDLVVVSPIIACTPFFTLILGIWVFNEANIDARTVAAVGLVVPSVILIGLR